MTKKIKSKLFNWNYITIKSNSKTGKISRLKWVINHLLFNSSILFLGLVISLSLMLFSAGLAQGRSDFIVQLRVIESEKTGLQYPMGLAFSPKASAFYVINDQETGNSPAAATDIINLTTLALNAGTTRIPARIKYPINVAFDKKFDRLLILQFPENLILEVSEGLDEKLDPNTLIPYDARSFGLQNPQGMTVDPTDGTLYILDAVGPRIVRIQPGQGGSFTGATISEISFVQSGLDSPRGLALDPSTRNLYFVIPAEHRLYGINQSGSVVATHDLSQFPLMSPQGIVFAPSGDQTDDPLQTSLYITDNSSGQIFEFSLINSVSMSKAESMAMLFWQVHSSPF